MISQLLSYMHACTTYYHQGSDLCADLEPFFKTLADEVSGKYYEPRTFFSPFVRVLYILVFSDSSYERRNIQSAKGIRKYTCGRFQYRTGFVKE